MPVNQPNPPTILPPQQSSAGSVKDQASQIRYSGQNTQSPQLWAMVSAALTSIQNQLDPIVKALRGAQPQGQLTQVSDSKGNPQVLLGDMIGVDKKAFSGLWVFQLAIGGKGPGDLNGAVIGVATGGIVVFSGDISVGSIQASGSIQAVQDISSTTGKVSAEGDITSAAGNVVATAGNLEANNGSVLAHDATFTTTVQANKINLNQGVGESYQIGGVQVLGPQKSGWTLPTGTVSRATFNTGTAVDVATAQRLAALIDDLFSTGVIGP